MDGDGEFRFELARLGSYGRDEILAELRRVAELIPADTLTRSQFDAIARVASSTVVRRFGDWRTALQEAGLSGRYSGRRITEKMRRQPAREMSDDDLLREMRRVAALVGGGRVITRESLRENSSLINDSAVVRRFGSWGAAVERAGLELSPHGRRWSDDDYFENLLTVWVHHARQPIYREMDEAPSRITSGAYEAKFGTWRRSLESFIERVNSDQPPDATRTGVLDGAETTTTASVQAPTGRATGPTRVRSASLGLRYRVLARDRFRCQVCGRSPATDTTCVLHVDHVTPVSRGGETVESNLRALCAECNLGKGSRLETATRT